MEADRLELAMDTLRKALENSQMDLRETERTLRQEQREKQRLRISTDILEKEVNDKKAGSQDLKLQVKEELQKNAILERQVDEIDHYKQRSKDLEEELKKLRKEAHQQSMIAQHARKCLRDERDKVKEQSRQDLQVKQVEEELDVIQSENRTLKKLLDARSTVHSHHAQVINNAKRLARQFYAQTQSDQLSSLLAILESEAEMHHVTGELKNQLNKSSSSTSSSTDGLLKTILRQTNNHSCSFTNSTDRLNFTRHQISTNFTDFRHSTGARMNRSWSQEEISKSRRRTVSNSSSRVSRNKAWTEGTKEEREEEKQEEEEEGQEEMMEEIVRNSVAVGDKVIIDVTPNKACSAGPHGRVKIRKLVYVPAKVMFIGCIENARDRPGLYIGVHLDDPVGTSDGVFRGKRYFTTNIKHGKFVRAKNIISILDIKSGKYKKIENIVASTKHAAALQQKKLKQQSRNEKPKRKVSPDLSAGRTVSKGDA
ncbi:hypothetical protein CAPTEDRAFT_223421 [Capitella teleta]|uniref:CAP-Gly domain-containing protein n=1 Tax=Capitella teleta TaxID=283909 RepID=R7U9K0_CAPTE|nr:hypothetical protein CAPTEDRAFT_223421 [Capitella teleta]|eukprot:ELU02669.1 hypothetical protein CAPTEDRAFT_223421 [Capitella teleta]